MWVWVWVLGGGGGYGLGLGFWVPLAWGHLQTPNLNITFESSQEYSAEKCRDRTATSFD